MVIVISFIWALTIIASYYLSRHQHRQMYGQNYWGWDDVMINLFLALFFGPVYIVFLLVRSFVIYVCSVYERLTDKHPKPPKFL
jgi:heme/copper-type cytochrome/quinol oxidase subunit 2